MKTFWYLATPYGKYPDGIFEAFDLACKQAALLIHNGVKVYAPIVHIHPIAITGNFDPKDNKIWLDVGKPFMDLAHGIIMVKAESWELSHGMKHELDTFINAGKPVIWMEPDIFPEEFVPIARLRKQYATKLK